MIDKLETKDKRALIIGGICFSIYIIGVFLIKPILIKQLEAGKQIENKIFFIKRYYEILNQKAYYEQKSKATKKIDAALSRRFLDQKKPALAAAALQKILESYAQKTSVSIESSRIEKPKYVERILAIPVEINVRSNLRNLVQFIQRLENHQKFIAVEELALRRSNKIDPEELESRLLALGFIQFLEPKKDKK
tara:strand:+ start:3527 stop:4105 length:579 start_codon:yes stop_codon:yes gene_type:complete